MNQHKTGLTLGYFAALVHLFWSVLVAFGWAQPLSNFVYRMHSLGNPNIVMPFNLLRSVGLIILTFFIGYVVGNVFAFVWNKVHK